MSEFLAVVAIYFVLSFLAMALLWTVAAKKGKVRAPAFLFWLKSAPRPEARESIRVCEQSRSNVNILSGFPMSPAQSMSANFSKITVYAVRGRAHLNDNQGSRLARIGAGAAA